MVPARLPYLFRKAECILTLTVHPALHPNIEAVLYAGRVYPILASTLRTRVVACEHRPHCSSMA